MGKNRFGFLLVLAAQGLAVFALVRCALLVSNWSGVPHAVLPLGQAFFIGARMDGAVLAVLAFPIALYFLCAPEPWFKTKWHMAVTAGAYFTFLYVFVFLNVADFFFFDEFNSRFNYIAIDYLFLNPTEVVANIWQSYPVVAVLFLVGVITWILQRPVKAIFHEWISNKTAFNVKAAGFSVFALAAAILFKSVDIGVLNANPNRILAEISADGLYTLGYALMTNHMDFDAYYATTDLKTAFERIKKNVFQPGEKSLGDGENPILRHVPARAGLGKANVVIILEESLGSKFVGALGAKTKDLTPNLDALARHGLFFTHFFATGTRTVRGLEAVLSSFPPIPGTSIVKRKDSPVVASIARVLKGHGYNTVFVYGGRGIFDNMRPFMIRNGFDRFIEQNDFANPTFTTAWGVCDEDIFDKSIETFDALEKTGKPFFATVLSVSNHKPYSYPAGRIDLDPKARSRDHAVKYADWALGHFFERAKSRAFFKNTIFVVLGDHGARVYGADFIPIDSYEIPLLIYSPALLPSPKTVATVGCSMDVAPTILGLLGLPYDSTFYGRDILHLDPTKAYALMQHDRDVSLFRDNRLAVLGTRKESGVYEFNPIEKSFTKIRGPDILSRDLTLDAISFYQTAYYLYSHGRYR